MAKVTRFRAGYGLSAEINGIWHKFNAEIEIEMENGDDVQEQKRKAWNTVIAEVEKQVEEALQEKEV